MWPHPLYIIIDHYCRCKFEIIGGRQLVERIKLNILEIQENFENFLDKKEMTFEVSESVGIGNFPGNLFTGQGCPRNTYRCSLNG